MTRLRRLISALLLLAFALGPGLPAQRHALQAAAGQSGFGGIYWSDPAAGAAADCRPGGCESTGNGMADGAKGQIAACIHGSAGVVLPDVQRAMAPVAPAEGILLSTPPQSGQGLSLAPDQRPPIHRSTV